jgi:DNA-binding protein YbaB
MTWRVRRFEVDEGHADLLQQMRSGLEQIEQANAAAEDRLARLDGLTDKLAEIRASVTSPDGSVTVVAGTGGGIRDVQFSSQATRLSPTRLSEVVMTTLRQAVAEAARKQASTVDEATGERITDRVLKTQESVLGPAASPAAESRRSAPPEDDAVDSFEDRDLFGRNAW